MEMTVTGANPFAAIDRARTIRMAAQLAASRSAAEGKAEISYGDRRHQGYLKPRRTHTTGPAKGSPPFARGRHAVRVTPPACGGRSRPGTAKTPRRAPWRRSAAF